MTVTPRPSLLDASAHATSPLAEAAAWVNNLLLNELAVGISVLAIALIGLIMLTGRMPFRAGGRTSLGIFVLLGAPSIAAAFSLALEEASPPAPPVPFIQEFDQNPRGDLPPADYDPYAGASLRRD